MRRSKQLERVVREFDDRGNQWLLESPENLRGLLLVVAREIAERLDFTRLEQMATRFIPDNLRKQEADLLFRIPYRPREGEGPQDVLVYILLENQSRPEFAMGIRLFLYRASIWDKQRRQYLDQKVPESQWRFLPIIPIVFYTGERKWEMPLSLSALMDLPEELASFVPEFEPLMLNLKVTAPEELTASGHPFGWLLRVIQMEHASEEELQRVLEEAVAQLAPLAEEDRSAWEKAIYYMYTLVHHRRGTKEAARLTEKITERVRSSRGRKAAQDMAQTSAEYLREEGMKLGEIRGIQKALLELMSERFGAVPAEVAQRVRVLEDSETLSRLLRQVVHAGSIEEMGL